MKMVTQSPARLSISSSGSHRTAVSTARQSADMIVKRRAIIADQMVRRRDIAEITLLLAMPVESGGLGCVVSEGTIIRDMGIIRSEWEAEAKRRVRHGLIDELAMLDHLQRSALPETGAPFDAARTAASLAISDRRTRLLGLDLETRSKLAISSDGPLSGADITTVLERARAARARLDADNTVDVSADSGAGVPTTQG